jgi:hypothetical protein
VIALTDNRSGLRKPANRPMRELIGLEGGRRPEPAEA